MEVLKISLKDFLSFYKLTYKNDRNFKDNKTSLIKIVCSENRSFFASSKQETIAVKDGGKTVCACVLIIHKNAAEMLSVAFFEALPGSESAVNMLLEYAGQYGRQNKCRQMVISLDGHVNNGISFPAGEGVPSFGESYCPQYYHDYFKNFDKIKFTSFYDEIDQVKARITQDLPKLEKLKENITLEYADFGSGFAETMRRYTDLNNEIFADHKHYFHREYNEDYDLFYDMRPLLKNENLIFAKHEGKYVGFILWYPDFNELVPAGKGASAITLTKYKLFCQRPKTAKVVEIGVEEKYRRYGTILLLFDSAMKSTAANTNKILSSWILDENAKSKFITKRYTAKHYKDYYAYEKTI